MRLIKRNVGWVQMNNDENRLDTALLSLENDELEREPFVDNLIDALVVREYDEKDRLSGRKSTGFIVGLTGEWGAGKSSILNFVKQKLDDLDHVSVAFFNPWIFSGRDELLNGFFSELREALGKSTPERVDELRSRLDNYWYALELAGRGAAIAADVSGGGGLGSKIAEVVFRNKPGRPETKSPLKERKALETKLGQSGQAVVVIIDELDRVEDDEVRAVAQLIKAVGDIRGISYLVSYDHDRVALALGKGERDAGERYIEKIIQHPVPIRPLFDHDVWKLLKSSLIAHGSTDLDWDEITDTPIMRQLLLEIKTPRDIKRLIGSFSIMNGMVRPEINPLHVLGYCWLLVKTQTLTNSIANKIDSVVDDPSMQSMTSLVSAFVDRGSQRPKITDVLGEEAGPHEEMLKALFPSLTRDTGEEQRDGTRISKRQNLIRLLYLGNPPNQISRMKIVSIWKEVDKGEVENFIGDLKRKNLLRQFIAQVSDFALDLSADGDKMVWLALASALVREQPWAQGPQDLAEVASDAADALLYLSSLSPEMEERVQAIVLALISDGDLMIVPYLFRDLIIHFGLSKSSTRKKFDKRVFEIGDTGQLLKAECRRYAEAVESGNLLKIVPSFQAPYVLMHTGNWSDDLKQNLGEQISERNALVTLASLLVPPGYTMEHSSLETLVDTEKLKSLLDDLAPFEDWPQDPWLLASIKRLRALSHGKDPMWLDRELEEDQAEPA